MSEMRDDLERELSTARQTIQQQARELAELRDLQADTRFANGLRESLVRTATATAIAAPAEHNVVLDEIVKTAADVMRAQAASLFVLDEERSELIFQVALGDKAESVKQFRVPLGRGIAGYVAATGQPIAIADAAQDPRFARDIGQAVGYIPKTILCVPLYLNGRVIGVLEMLDKAGAASFSAADMDLLVRFANLAALALDQSRLMADFGRLFRTLLTEAVQAGGLTEPMAPFAERAADYAEHTDALMLARLVHDIVQQGERGIRLTLELLTSLARFLKANGGPA
jgi:transcriptional regulator with GAF, ATPase, and Fis domain